MDKQTFINAFQHLRKIPCEHDVFAEIASRDAAVLILLIERDNGLHILFTRRAAHLKHHAGQISFPGGKYEASDDTLCHTALRETQEEIGIAICPSKIIGTLGQYSTITGFQVTPYIAIIDSLPPIQVDKNEVEYTFEVPLAHCISPDNFMAHTVTRKQQLHNVYFIPWQNTYIWGATAGMLKHLANHLSAE